jgi:hypothetical protein
MAEVTAYPVGQGAVAGQYKPGDFILTHGSAWYSKIIRHGQALRYKGGDAAFAYYNHAAIVVEEDGTILQAMNAGIVRGHISDYKQTEYHLVNLGDLVTDFDRKRMRAFAYSKLNAPYDWLCIAGIALSLLVRTRIILNMEGRYICSGIESFTLMTGGVDLPFQPQHMMPADLAWCFGVRPV